MTIEFHWYGFIMGLAIVLGWWLVEFRHTVEHPSTHFLPKNLDTLFSLMVVFGFLGARAWHVFTDWHYYTNDWLSALYVWRGGMSSIGAFLGGFLGLLTWSKINYSKQDWQARCWYVLDLMIFGLPAAQAVGRLGNWVNQELYGLPTTLPWGIFIEPHLRVERYAQFVTFHPLFAYEAALTLLFAGVAWASVFYFKVPFKLGSGWWFLSYGLYYSVLRFFLDFLRADRTVVGEISLGINQLILLFFITVLFNLIHKRVEKKLQLIIQKIASFFMVIFLVIAAISTTKNWLSDPLQVTLDNDEVAWVLDAEVVDWYMQKEWENFSIIRPFHQINWFEREYRVIDQPQLGKYIFGLQLRAVGVIPWESPQKDSYYQGFADARLPSGNIYTLLADKTMDEQVVGAIGFLRTSNTLVGLVTIALLSGFVGWQVRSVRFGLLMYIFVLGNPLIVHYYRLAVVNAWSAFFQFLAYVLISLFYHYGDRWTKHKSMLVGFVTGCVIAAATSVKLDGLFWMLAIMFAYCVAFVLNRKQLEKLHIWLCWILGIIFGMLVALVLLEPATMLYGWHGFATLVASRMWQQDKFAIHFVNHSWPALFLLWFKSLVNLPLMGKGAVIVLIFHLISYVFVWRLSSLKWSRKELYLSLSLFLVALCSIYVSRVGIDRYIIQAVVIGYGALIYSVARLQRKT